MQIVDDEKRNPIDFGSKVNFNTLCIKCCGHDTDNSFCPITFKLHMHVMDDERRNPIDFGSTLGLCL